MAYSILERLIGDRSGGSVQDTFTIGRVVDTNDPQQMGRVRAICPGFDDSTHQTMGSLPWAFPVSPLAGMVSFGKRGAEESDIKGPVAYGMWNTPKIGSLVIIGCVDGDRKFRFYVGGLHPQMLAHTAPHGRYTWHDQTNGKPDGPLDTYEGPIEPLYSNLTAHFKKFGEKHAVGTPDDPRRNMEWRSRGLDDQVSAMDESQVNHPQDGSGSAIADHLPTDDDYTKIIEENGDPRRRISPGYGIDQQEPNDKYEETGGKNFDSHTYSWTTPGFHSFSMNDRHDNSRIRIRTTSGHQIIMDDTNQRIYLSTAAGNTWIELDSVGNIDIYAARNISTHAGGDINFFADKTIRMQAKQGVHIQTDDEYRIHAKKDVHIRSEQNIRTHSKLSTFLQSDERFHVYSRGTLYLASTNDNIDLDATDCIHSTSGNETHIRSGANMFLTGGPRIDLNGPPAEAAVTASIAAEKQSFWTTRVPEHEPWARIFMNLEADKSAGNGHTPEYSYTDQMCGKGSAVRGDLYTGYRSLSPHWHR